MPGIKEPVKAAAEAIAVSTDASAALSEDTDLGNEHRVSAAESTLCQHCLGGQLSFSWCPLLFMVLSRLKTQSALGGQQAVMPYSKTPEMLQVRRFMPFSVGPRDCIGQNLAKVNYQTTVPMLLSNFSFKLAEEVPNCPLCCSNPASLPLRQGWRQWLPACPSPCLKLKLRCNRAGTLGMIRVISLKGLQGIRAAKTFGVMPFLCMLGLGLIGSGCPG